MDEPHHPGASELIGKMLLKNTTLCTLEIRNIKMIHNVLRLLAEALLKNRTLVNLELNESKIFSSLSIRITDVLYWNSSLISLDLYFMDIDEVEIQKLSKILKKDNKLRRFSIFGIVM